MKTKTKGQALTEFALTLPILLLLLLGIIEGARIIWAYITVQNAAREATRYAITGQPYDASENPWTVRPDRSPGCDPQLDDQGRLKYSPDLVGGGDCTGPNDRVDAIVGVALVRGRDLGIGPVAIQPGHYTATGYIDAGGAYGVRVIGQEFDAGQLSDRIDFAGEEGLNVLVQVYYNVKILDPLYAAIIPNGFVHLAGEVQMQNEGIDSALGNVAPVGINPPEAPEGGAPPAGSGNDPIIISLDGSTVAAGSDFRVKLEYHEPSPPPSRYDVWFYNSSLGSRRICSNLETDNFGSVSVATCNVPADMTAGSYRLVSVVAGADGGDPANHVAQGDYIDVTYTDQPIITIVDGNQWPPGSIITIELRGHEACPPGKSPCPPYQSYDIALIGGIFSSPGTVFATLQVDQFGVASTIWTIPSNLAPGDYTLVTYQTGTIDPVIATTALKIVPSQIVIQGGNKWPEGVTIKVHLRGHAPNRTYSLCWIDGNNGSTIKFGPVTVDQFGDTIAPASFTIPVPTADSPPNHHIISFEGVAGDCSSAAVVASTDVEVFTPPNPFIVVVGGVEWPAGSLIQIELHKHFSGPYNLYFEGTLIESDISPNASGFYQTTYIIPIATANGSYEIRTERVSDGGTEATLTIDVTSVPLIQVAEGTTVQPGADITIELLHHPPNDSFEIYLDGNLLFNIPTNASGSGSRIYDLSNLPGLLGGPFLLESRQGGVTIASIEIYIIAPDLQVTDIEFPTGPPIDTEIPVTVTVFNDSTVSVTGEYFDVDLYIDPIREPVISSQFPPGDYKRWLNSIPPNSTAQTVFNLTLSGADHMVYGRVDTSNYVIETDDTNNIYEATVLPPCAVEADPASGADWTGVDYGDADIPPSSFSVSGGAINLVSDGSSSFGSSDNLYFVYYNSPVPIIGDFDLRVRMTEGPGDDAGEQDWAKAGLEVRSNVGSASSPKVELAAANSGHVSGSPGVLAAYRDGGDTSRPDDATTDVAVDYPVWLRIVRNGDDFTYYYSDSDLATPPAVDAWTAHGSVQMSNMGNLVTVGLFNTSYSSSATDTSSFDSFHLCIKDNATCGAVDETDGRIVLEAVNYTAHTPRTPTQGGSGEHRWEQYVWNGFVGMRALPDNGTNQNTDYAANSPELQYQANFDASGTYYVWVYGRGPDGSSDSVHVGLDGAEIATADRMGSFPSGSIGWSNSTMDVVRASINVASSGLHTINVWMREDGFQFFKLLLTDDPSFVPSGNIDQSPCSGTEPGGSGDEFPPGLEICTGNLFQNSGFENSLLAPWTAPNGAVNKNDQQYEGQFAAFMYTYITGAHQQPALGQPFDMPDWIISSTTSIDLSLYRCVRDYTGSGAEPDDHLDVGLRSIGITPTLISTPTLVADGNTTDTGPCLSTDYTAYSTDLAAAIKAVGSNPEDYAGQPLELYLYDTSSDLSVCNAGGGPSNSACYETDYRLDEVELEVCTRQPIPPHEPGKATIGGPLRVFIGGAPRPKQGVRVWTYKQNGELLITYTLHDSNYFFYNVDPGEYVIYAEHWEGSDLYSAFTTVTVGADETITNLSLLLR
jgi:hypothetical protein